MLRCVWFALSDNKFRLYLTPRIETCKSDIESASGMSSVWSVCGPEMDAVVRKKIYTLPSLPDEELETPSFSEENYKKTKIA